MVRRSECNHPLWNMNPQTPSRRPRGHLAVIALFIVLFLHAVLEATQRAQDPTGELAVLLWMQVSEALICLTVLVGLIRRSPWRPIAIVVLGGCTQPRSSWRSARYSVCRRPRVRGC